ncbi:MAG: hypothetical protein ACRCT2_11970 [Plesiomonas shigelloides]
MTTIQQLQAVLPGQTAEWYARIAAEIDAGRMPMPSLEPPPNGTYSYSKSDLNPIHRTEVVRPTPKTSPKNTVKPAKISARLLELCNGNHATAQRLLDFTLQNNPGKTAQWANEKAVWDLERDRGAR